MVDSPRGSRPGMNFALPINRAQATGTTINPSKPDNDHLRIQPNSIQFPSSRAIPENLSVGNLTINNQTYSFTSSDLFDNGEIGRGAFGTVNCMTHTASNMRMAVKRIRSTVDEREQKRLLMDLGVIMRSNECPFIVQFFGALFWEGDCWICMELMATSLDKFYRFVYQRLGGVIPEDILGKIAYATVKALDYLKEKLQIIHRDVKPSNILIDRNGGIKLCDFGISGQLVNSIARTQDAGCKPYMAPERIDPSRTRDGYDVRSDIWSLGITLLELSTGKFPYPKWNTVFDQLTQVVKGDPPKLPNNSSRKFSDAYMEFVNTCTIKDSDLRPKYDTLLQMPFLIEVVHRNVNLVSYFCQVLDRMTPEDFRGIPSGDT